MSKRDIRSGALALALVTLCPLLAAASSSAPPASGSVLLTTPQGQLRGSGAAGVQAFRGIPYAAAPVGPLRWAPPQPARAWREVRDAEAFGPHCPQSPGPGHFATASQTEDCLFLNVFKPAKAHKGARLPVMVWIPGGGLHSGESDDYDGAGLARAGKVIVVTINYRLGVLGFFAGATTPGSANFGLLDQQQALRWVRSNIMAFGGDPANVTLFGESAGADSVLAQMLSPPAAGLFQRAIVESSAYFSKTTPLADARARAQQFTIAAGCAGDDSLNCLRALPVDKILVLQTKYLSPLIIDGVTVPEPFWAAFQTGRFHHVDLLIGTNLEEYRFYEGLGRLAGPNNSALTAVVTGLQQTYPDLRARLRQGYGDAGADTAAMTDAIFTCPTARIDNWASAYGRVYAYQFVDTDAPAYEGVADYRFGASHTSELQYVFPGFRGAGGQAAPLTGPQERLSAAMIGAWTAFARTGHPTDPDSAGDWPAFRQADPVVEQLAPAGLRPSRSVYGDHHCQVWEPAG